MKSVKRKINSIIPALTGFLLVISSSSIYAQCSLCASNVKSSVNSSTHHAGLGLNPGIITLLVMPYLVVGVVGVLWYVNRKAAGGNDH